MSAQIRGVLSLKQNKRNRKREKKAQSGRSKAEKFETLKQERIIKTKSRKTKMTEGGKKCFLKGSEYKIYNHLSGFFFLALKSHVKTN